jgi:hypothetical protein
MYPAEDLSGPDADGHARKSSVKQSHDAAHELETTRYRTELTRNVPLFQAILLISDCP